MSKGYKIDQAKNPKDGKQWVTVAFCLDGDFGPSKSGKTVIVATSEGNVPVGTSADGKVVRMGLNVYKS